MKSWERGTIRHRSDTEKLPLILSTLQLNVNIEINCLQLFSKQLWGQDPVLSDSW